LRAWPLEIAFETKFFGREMKYSEIAR